MSHDIARPTRRLADWGGMDVFDLLGVDASGDGVAWSANPEGVNVNLVVLGAGGSIEEHRNDAIDVALIVLDGRADVLVDGTSHAVSAGAAMVVPRGATRGVRSEAGVRYLTIHRARPALSVSPQRPSRVGPSAL